MTVDDLVRYYQQGVYTRKEFVFKALQLISVENTNDVLTRIPHECLQEIRAMIREPSTDDAVMFAGELSADETDLMRLQLNDAVARIRRWFADHKRS